MKLTEAVECRIPVESIFGSSLAKNLGFDIGDLIQCINGRRITSRMDVYEILDGKNISEFSVLRKTELVKVSIQI